jgi:hypothetical protein
MRWWLIRHQDLTFTGPITELSLISRIEGGELAQKDEICASCGYWFSIQDVSEVRKFLGEIKLQRNIPNDGETSTTIQGNVKTLITPVPVSASNAHAKAQDAAPQGARTNPQRARPAQQGPVDPKAFEVLEEEPVVSVWSQIALILVIVLIFSGTVYLLWTNSRK